MVEIIEAGTKNRIECNNCGALLSYSAGDVRREEIFYTQMDSRSQYYIICPQCKNKINKSASR